MKKYILKVMLIGILFGIVGCDADLLDTPPNDRVTSDMFWQTEDDVDAALAAVYSKTVTDAFTFVMWDAMSDIGHVTLQWRDQSHIELGAFDSSIPPIKQVWDDCYAAIRGTNEILQHLSTIDFTNENSKNNAEGQARFLRAFFYTKLISLFGGVPIISDPISLEDAGSVSRASLDDSWNFVSNDLGIAANLLPEEQNKIGMATKGAALSLLGRAMLIAKRFDESANASKAVMDLGLYKLYPEYKSLFSYIAENNEEIIFDKQYVKDIQSNDIFANSTPNSLFPQVSNYVPNRRLVDSYFMKNGLPISDPNSGYDPLDPNKNRDPRLKYTVYIKGDALPNGKIYDPTPGSGTGDEVGSSENSTGTGFNAKKYVNPEDLGDPRNCGINIILIRYAEVLLNFAEAKIELNQIDQSVIDAINEVRDRADVKMPLINEIKSQEEMRSLVRHERLVELAFEGQRYVDIRRWKIAEDVMPGPIIGMDYLDANSNLKTVEVTGFTRQFNKNRDYLWPIPNTEIVLNPNLEQNPGW